MALHELATNAIKYGALSSSEGRVTISWTEGHDREGRRFLNMLWQEQGGPPVSPPHRQGFGSRLLSRVFGEVGGSARQEYLPEGLRCVISLPLSTPDETVMLDVPQDPRRVRPKP
jgi:two-component sensor histidine kinase